MARFRHIPTGATGTTAPNHYPRKGLGVAVTWDDRHNTAGYFTQAEWRRECESIPADRLTTAETPMTGPE